MNLNFKYIARNALCAILLASGLISCEETSEIGSSVVEDKVEVVIDSVFEIKGFSQENNIRYARTSNQLLGSIDAKGYGSLSSDFVAQLMPANKMETDGVTADNIDSIKFAYVHVGGCICRRFRSTTRATSL